MNLRNQQDNEPDDDFPNPTDDELGLIPVVSDPEPAKTPTRAIRTTRTDSTGTLNVLLHLAVGGILLGIDEVRTRLDEKNEFVESSSQSQETLYHPDDEQDQLRYALVGLVLKTPEVLSRGAHKVEQAAEAGVYVVNKIFKPVTKSRLANPFIRKFDHMVARGESIVTDWVDRGRTGEKTSRVLLQQTSDEVIGDVANILANRPEIRDLVQQQGIGMAQEVSGELQDRAAAADTLFERIVLKFLPGSKKDTTRTLDIPQLEEYDQRK